MRLTFFEREQVEAIRRIIRAQMQRRKPDSRRGLERQSYYMYRDARMAIVTTEITARSGDIMGAGEARLLRLEGGTLTAFNAAAIVPVYSISPTAIAVGEYVFSVQDHSGRYIAIPFC